VSYSEHNVITSLSKLMTIIKNCEQKNM